MDKADIEILKALKKENSFHSLEEIEHLSDNLPERKKTLEKLKILQRDEFVKHAWLNYRSNYNITTKGVNLIWKGDVELQIVKLLYYTEKCTGEEMEYFLDFGKDAIACGRGNLRDEQKITRKKEPDGRQSWVLTEEGRKYARYVCEDIDYVRPTVEEQRKSGFFDKTWKKLLALGAGAAALYAIWQLIEKISTTFSSS